MIPEADGSETNMGNITESGFFACANACIPGQKYLASAVAKKETKILFLKLSNLFESYAIKCRYASMMTVNVLRQIAEEKVIQDKRIRVMGQKSIRTKLISYIEEFLTDINNGIKTMNNQELANFLFASLISFLPSKDSTTLCIFSFIYFILSSLSKTPLVVIVNLKFLFFFLAMLFP